MPNTDLQSALRRAKRVLAILEEEAAGYTSLTIPAHLRIELEDKRREVASLESRLAQQAGRPDAALADNLPRRPPIFVGRQDEIARCLEGLDPDERGWGVVIDGIGGIGKTALALEAAHIAQERGWFDAYLFASAKTSWLTPDGIREDTLALSSLDAFTRHFARHLKEPEIERMSDAEARYKALLDVLRGRRALLIWDNLETLTEEERDRIALFLRKLPSPNKAIVTSRRRAGESALTIRLSNLKEQESLELMQEFGRRHPRAGREIERADPRLLRELHAVAGGNPLAILWTLGLLEKGHSLPQALRRLRDAARSGDLYRFLFADVSRDLTLAGRKVLAALVTFQAPASPNALADVTGLVKTEVQVALERLLGLSLVNDLTGGRYGLHPLTRVYVLSAMRGEIEGLAFAPRDHRKSLRYWLDYARQYGGQHKDAYKTFDRLEAEWPNLEAAAAQLWQMTGLPGELRDAEAAGMLNDLADALRSFLWFRGYWDERIRLAAWAYEAMAAAAKWRDAGWRAYDAAWIHYNRKETDRAAAWAKRCAEAWEKGGRRRDCATAVRLRGLLAQQRGDLDEAERLYTEALETCRDLGERADEAIVLNDLGALMRKRKKYDRAEGYYRAALEIAEKSDLRESQAYITGNLGLLALARERWDEARAYFERALPLAQEVGRKTTIAFAKWGLARVLEEEGRYAEALPLAEESLRIRERLRHMDVDESRELVARLRERLGG